MEALILSFYPVLSTCSDSTGWLCSYLHTQLFFSSILQLWRQVYIRPYGTSCSTGNSSSTSDEDVWCCHSNFFIPVFGMSTLFHRRRPCLLQSLLLHTGMLPEEQWLVVKTLAWASAKLSSESYSQRLWWEWPCSGPIQGRRMVHNPRSYPQHV